MRIATNNNYNHAVYADVDLTLGYTITLFLRKLMGVGV